MEPQTKDDSWINYIAPMGAWGYIAILFVLILSVLAFLLLTRRYPSHFALAFSLASLFPTLFSGIGMLVFCSHEMVIFPQIMNQLYHPDIVILVIGLGLRGLLVFSLLSTLFIGIGLARYVYLCKEEANKPPTKRFS